MAGIAQRLTFLVRDEIDVMRESAPADLAVRARQGDTVVLETTVARRTEGIITPYFPLVMTFDAPGEFVAELPDHPTVEPVPFLVADRVDIEIPQVGDPLPSAPTPTVDDSKGVTPICTRAIECPFHEIDLVDAVANDKPTVLLISTPGFCQTDICGPVLDLLIDEAGDRTDLNVIHAEVYVDPSDFATGGFPELTPAVNAMALPFEPAIFVAAADNSIRAGSTPPSTAASSRRARSSDQRSKTTNAPPKQGVGQGRGRSPESGSAERLATAAGALGVGVVDREAGVLEAVLVVEGCTLEQLGRLGIDDDVDATEVLGDVVGGAIGVEVHLVGEARAAPGRTATRRASPSSPSALMSSLTFEAALSVSMIMVGSS